ncbi:MAG: winged helix DNA-binding protein [Thermoguttaceae bacterium]|nr:winged helix DNA-binding protein [Thermoguttaceae bacterium]
MKKSKNFFLEYDPCAALFLTVSDLFSYGNITFRGKKYEAIQSLSPRQRMVLFTIEAATRREPDGIPLSAITRAMNIPAPSASQLVETLVKKDLVSRTTNPQNHRSVLITLTETGKTLTRDIAGTVDGKLRELQEGLSTKEIETFERVVLHCFSRKGEVLK